MAPKAGSMLNKESSLPADMVYNIGLELCLRSVAATVIIIEFGVWSSDTD